jgi:hypothetical protein
VGKHASGLLLFWALILCLVVVGCSGAGTSAGNDPAKALNSISIAPNTVILTVNTTQQLTVTGKYSDGSQADVTNSVNWATSNASVATVNPNGLLTAVAAGTAAMTANVGSVSATASVTVNTVPKTLNSITIAPSQLTLPQGSTRQLSAAGNYSDGTQGDLTSTVNWSSSNAATAAVTATGLLSAAGTGLATVTANYSSITASLGVVVNGTGANIVTWHYDNGRTGLNPNETTLTTANVNSNDFGKLFSYLVDGYIYAQPLFVSNITIAGTPHNVVFVATENDSVYAFDADQYGNGSPLWKVSLLQTGETPQPPKAIAPYQGITSTPAIDLTSNTMYVVSAQKATGSPFFRLHALDLSTGAEKPGGPVAIAASVPGTNGAVNGVVSLTTACIQRSALLLANNAVLIGFGGCSSGWLLSYDAHSLTQIGVFNTGPTADVYGQYGGGGGVWMGAGGPAADANGSIYITTGDGTYDGSTNFGNSAMKFNTQLQLLDHFTPYTWALQQCTDSDLDGGGVMLLPGASEILIGSKNGKMFLLNTANLGGMQANDAGATQWLWFEQDLAPASTTTCTDDHGNVLTGQTSSYQIHGTAAFFNGTAYVGAMPSQAPIPGPVRQFIYGSGQLTPGSATAESIQPGSYGTTPFVSSSGSTNGIVWVLDHGAPLQNFGNLPVTSAILRAYDAANFPAELYNSSQNASDAPGLGIKFTSPIVANGKVFIGTGHDPVATPHPQGELNVYGLKN